LRVEYSKSVHLRHSSTIKLMTKWAVLFYVGEHLVCVRLDYIRQRVVRSDVNNTSEKQTVAKSMAKCNSKDDYNSSFSKTSVST
jgi:hypothetical protein